MTMSFPTLSQGQDSRFFSIERENPAIATPVEGGYVQTRARFTRRPPSTFATGFSELTEADRGLVDAFWDDVAGGAVPFYWTNPVTSVAALVRFTPNEPLKWAYAGHGSRFRWTLQFSLQEV